MLIALICMIIIDINQLIQNTRQFSSTLPLNGCQFQKYL